MQLKFYTIGFLFIGGVLTFISCQKELSCEGCLDNNKPPIANAGADQQISLPTDSILIDGSSSIDPDGTITSYKWRKMAGPSSANINKPDSSKTVVNNFVPGVYQFELTVKDNGGISAKDTMLVIVNNLAVINQPPTACAGADQVIMLPFSSVALDGSCSTDQDNNITNYEWTKISGPSAYNFTTSNAVKIQVSALMQGVYQFELIVTDAGGLFSKDTVKVLVENPPVNLPPFACAGADQFIDLPANSITLNGICSSDPDKNVTGYLWTKIAGPSSFTIVNTTEILTQVNDLVEGKYLFELKLTDAENLSDKDTVQITVNAARPYTELLFSDLVWHLWVDPGAPGLFDDVYFSIPDPEKKFAHLPSSQLKIFLKQESSSLWELVELQTHTNVNNCNSYVYTPTTFSLYVFSCKVDYGLVGKKVSVKVLF